MADDPEITDPRDPYKQRDIVAELDEAGLGFVTCEPGYIKQLLQRARDEIVALREALQESLRLQKHYAALLNDYDGGERMLFADAEEWLRRLRKLIDEGKPHD